MGGFFGGDEGGEEGDAGAEKEAFDNVFCCDEEDFFGDNAEVAELVEDLGSQNFASDEAEEDAGEGAEEADDEGFLEDEDAEVVFGGADCFEEADFFFAFADCGEEGAENGDGGGD